MFGIIKEVNTRKRTDEVFNKGFVFIFNNKIEKGEKRNEKVV